MNRQDLLEHLRATRPVIAPSMLKCDFGNQRREMERLNAAGMQLVHWDVMDGHFVPNLSYGAMVIAASRAQTDAPFDAHLMMSEPGRYLDDFLDAGCDAVTIHIEAVDRPRDVLSRIRSADRVAGLALNPGTPVERITEYLDLCDLVLIMSVEPGFGGQQFMPQVLPKLTELRSLAPDLILSIDGGIGPATIGSAAATGCDVFVAGSAIFNQSDYSQAVTDLTERAATGSSQGVA